MLDAEGRVDLSEDRVVPNLAVPLLVVRLDSFPDRILTELDETIEVNLSVHKAVAWLLV
jgi:hypothetical protein